MMSGSVNVHGPSGASGTSGANGVSGSAGTAIQYGSIDTNTEYVGYLADNLNKSISYSEYLSGKIDELTRKIDTTNTINPNLYVVSGSIDFSENLTNDSNTNYWVSFDHESKENHEKKKKRGFFSKLTKWDDEL